MPKNEGALFYDSRQVIIYYLLFNYLFQLPFQSAVVQMKSQPKIDLILRKGVAKAFIAEKVHAEALSSDSSASHETHQSATTNKLNTYGTVVEGQVAAFASPNASSVVSNKPDGHSNRVCQFKNTRNFGARSRLSMPRSGSKAQLLFISTKQ